MNINNDVLKSDEKIIFELRELYTKYGYSQFKMNKFEEYDTYVRNKSFLTSDRVITFTDTNGKLMALKPDVTLSIIKNTQDIPGFVQKVFYNENVYRVSKRTDAFKEIMQVGLESIGDVDDYTLCEVLYLAAKSLTKLSDRVVLDVSCLDLITEVLDKIDDQSIRKSLIQCISEKNSYELTKICKNSGVSQDIIDELKLFISTYGEPSKVLPVIKASLKTESAKKAFATFENVINAVSKTPIGNILRVDFSVINAMGYYNGIVFKGFIEGVPDSVLSGGQYDKLMDKMKRKSRAVGFAVYLDLLERLNACQREYDVDVVVLYKDSDDILEVGKLVLSIADEGKVVKAEKVLTNKYTYREVVKFGGNK